MTKSLLIGIAISLMMAGSLFSQTHTHNNMGVKAGVNLYNVHNSNTSDPDINLGLHLGLLTHMHLTEAFALQPEIYYSMQGSRSGDNRLNLGYVNVPILVQYMFAEGFRIQVGPQLGVLLHGNTNAANGSVRDHYNTLEAGISIGASYIHTPSSFGVDLRYNHGLTDITKSSLIKHTNRGVQIGVFYLFNHS